MDEANFHRRREGPGLKAEEADLVLETEFCIDYAHGFFGTALCRMYNAERANATFIGRETRT
jgi:hypothetical protein